MTNTEPIPAGSVAGITTVDEGLYLERLETLYEKGLSDIRAFAAREERSFEEVRIRLAEMHCRALFNLDNASSERGTSTSASTQGGTEQVSHILHSLSAALESLATIGGFQSFFLTVDPYDPHDEGFLGGTLLGREFWRGHRGCGAAGARAFQVFCRKSQLGTAYAAQDVKASSAGLVGGYVASLPSPLPSSGTSSTRPDDILIQSTNIQPANATAAKPGPAGALKTEVYAAMRNAVRQASGNRTAEMKWTNHANLASYGVRLEGWPADVPMHNPSTLTTAQNRRILEALARGTLRFIPLHAQTETSESPSTGERGSADMGSLQEQEDTVFAETVNFAWDGGADGGNIPTQPPSSLDFAVITTPPHTTHDSSLMATGSSRYMYEPPDTETSRKRKRSTSLD